MLRFFHYFACFLFVLSLSFAKPAPILVQGAMDIEVDALIEALENRKSHTFGSWTFWEGSFKGYPVVISRTEVGMANAAASTALGIAHFKPKWIINQGTSGGHDPKLYQGDIVLGERSFNMGSFKVEARKEKGIEPKKWQLMDVGMRLRENGEFVEYPQGFQGDAFLLKLAQAVGKAYQKGKVVVGVIGTADEWNREVERIEHIHKLYGTSTEEMETSASALVARAYKIPFLGIRILSNTDLHNQDFDPKTAKDCQLFVLDVLKALIES